MNILLLVSLLTSIVLFFKRKDSPRYKTLFIVSSVAVVVLLVAELGLIVAFRDIKA